MSHCKPIPKMSRASAFRPSPAVVAALLVSVIICTSLFALPRALYGSDAALQAKQRMAEGKRDEAKTLLLDAVKQNPRDDEAEIMLARIYMREQDYNMAAEHAERAVKLADSVSDYHLWLARTSVAKTMKSGMVGALLAARKGRQEYEKAIALDSANKEARFELCMYYLIAPGMLGGSKEKAKGQATVLESLDPLYGSYAWASYWERDQQIARAESLYNRAVGLDTSSTSTALYGLAYFYDRNKKPAQAGTVFKQILTNRPDDLVALFHLGRVYAAADTNLDEAESAFKRYLDVGGAADGPDEAAARWQLGMVYDRQGKPDSAVVELRRAVELAPGIKQYKDTLKQVEKRP